ncbi:MAG: hypothetical protein CVV64_05440 [Candidatus Wallbacteria bacterium HGW-Wallbacteria-1]|jgi:antitoxin component YwqK of YwqJK toxin-antitoxin module|uniref:MORN repeat-containing protein n=1 Tax=Candidatus Wallbacteria bacterium HGW-Wallbacteria-1 TaxID=2013854 RepID=A0A2N1PS94_9BACT|nr:MAG: hypothetical protein CVV64_05440 [Candidatus Wallbacteria bacterium HGW-Wallbacteria-1]
MQSKLPARNISPLLEGALCSVILISIVITIWSHHPYQGKRTGIEFFHQWNPRRKSSVSTFYSNGRVAEKGILIGRQKEGVWLKYHNTKDSPLYLKEHYKGGLLHGSFESFHENGKPWMIGFFEMGNRAGIWKIHRADDKVEIYSYDSNGKLKTADSPESQNLTSDIKLINESNLSLKPASEFRTNRFLSSESLMIPCGPVNVR